LNPAGGPKANPPGVSTADERSLVFWLTVQPTRNGKPEKEAFDSTGLQIFNNGWKFVFNVLPSQPGALYLINEGPGAGGQKVFNVLFPTTEQAIGAEIQSGETAQTGWNRFDENTGTETLWVIWSAKAVPELDTIFQSAFKSEGQIKDPAQIEQVKSYLNSHWLDEAQRPMLITNEERLRSFIRHNGNVMVHRVTLSHRDY
jgi:hypothetical protein